MKIYEIPTTVRVRAMIRIQGETFRDAIRNSDTLNWHKHVEIEGVETGEVEVVTKHDVFPVPNGVHAKIRVYDSETGEQLYDHAVLGFHELRNDPKEWPSD